MNNWKWVIAYAAGIMFAILVYFNYQTRQAEREIANSHWPHARAVIVEIKNRKRNMDFRYQFAAGNKTYEAWGTTDKPTLTGDTVEIVYNPDNPVLSMVAEKVK